ncbi:hypothetical protein GCM10023201_03020 [Actinomycetospora corticicola]
MPPVTGGGVDVVNAIGPTRGLLLLVVVATAAWRAVHLFRLDDGRDPLPWAIVLVLLVGVLAVISLAGAV